MQRSLLVTGLLLLPLVFLVQSGSWLWPAGAFVFLLGLASGSLRALLRPLITPTVLSLLISLVVFALWARFWVLDLHEARFRWVLLLLPGLALVGSALTRRAWGARLGAVLGLSSVLVWMLLRSDNGCTGVSRVYEQTMLGSALLVYGLGPWWVLRRGDDS